MKNYIILFLMLSLLISCSPYKKITCPDGEIVLIDRRLPTKDFNKEKENLFSTINKIPQIDLENEINIESKKKLDANLAEYDNYTSSLLETLNTLYRSLQMFPCDKKTRRNYEKTVKDIYSERMELAKSIKKIENTINSGGISGNNLEIINSVVKSLKK